VISKKNSERRRKLKRLRRLTLKCGRESHNSNAQRAAVNTHPSEGEDMEKDIFFLDKFRRRFQWGRSIVEWYRIVKKEPWHPGWVNRGGKIVITVHRQGQRWLY